MAKLSATLQVSQDLINIAEKVDRALIHKVLPRALDRAAPIIREAVIAELPDGDASGSRSLQTDKMKARFPKKMKKWVRIKKRTKKNLVLRIIGVTKEAGQVNIDHGDKAKTSGRVHKLWWRAGISERFAKINPRIQSKDIPKIVKAKTYSRVRKIVEETIERAASAGELI